MRTYGPFWVATLVLCCAICAVYPLFQYYVDPDATGYLTVVKYYAAGEYAKAINGYWSPWSCWLTVLFMKGGLLPFKAAIVANTLGAVGLLYITQSFFLKYNIISRLQWAMNLAMAGFLCYAVYAQSFADLWECFLLLVALRLIVSDRFKYSPQLWIAAGAIGALAYFAKAYAFPFFILNTLCCVFYLTRAWNRRNVVHWLSVSGVMILTMAIVSSPWLYALHTKYGGWKTSTAGTLNLSWYLVGHPFYKEGILHLLPPPYADGVSYWDDPWMVNGATPHFYSSAKLFALQMVRVGQNAIKFLKCTSEISVFFAFIWLMAVGMLLSRKLRCFFSHNKVMLPVLSFLLFPVAFLLINFEPRYVWYMLPLSMLIGAMVLQKGLKLLNGQRVYGTFIVIAFALSYLVTPVWEMQKMVHDGRDDYQAAQQLQQLGIKGSFTSNAVFGNDALVRSQRIAYFAGSQYYNMPYANVPSNELLQEMRRYGIKYYYYFYPDAVSVQAFQLKNEQGVPFKEVSGGRLPGIRIFQVYH